MTWGGGLPEQRHQRLAERPQLSWFQVQPEVPPAGLVARSRTHRETESVQIGSYTVLEEIARGGHGVVYRAQDAQGQVVALKLLLAHRAQNDHARKRFQAEANALARLRHAHVVPILGAGEHEGCPWLALEYVEGESLEARLRRGPLPIHEVIRVAQQLAQALSYVHSCGVLHRDLKPDNVLLRENQALLTDFGLALDDQSSLSRITGTGVFQGTPGYWAPEQAQGKTDQHGEQTDVYGLGAVLYACLAGQPPVQAASLQDYLQTVRMRVTRTPRRARPEVPAWLSELCMRCLALEPADRPASVDEVARALVLAGETRSAGRQRRKTSVPAALLGAVGLIGIVTLIWLTRGRAEPADSTPLPQGDHTKQVESLVELGPSTSKAAPLPEGDHAKQIESLMQSAVANLRAGRSTEAIEDCSRALDLDSALPGAYSWRGMARAMQERWAEAIKDYDRALALDPTSASTYQNRAASKSRLGAEQEAIEDYDKALELDPTSAFAYRGRGGCRAELGRNEEAIADYDRSLELEPDSTTYRNRGVCQKRLERPQEAIQDFDQALALDPRDARSHHGRGTCNFMLGRNEEAIVDFGRALELGLSVPTYASRGLSKLQLRRDEEAVADFDRALDLDPTDASAYRHRGVGQARLKRYEQAIADLDRALELDPNDAFSLRERGSCRAKQERHEEAIADYDRALALDPQSAFAYRKRGASKAELGRHAEAIKDFDKALELGLPTRAATDRVKAARTQAAAELEQGN